jgi:MFS family permease
MRLSPNGRPPRAPFRERFRQNPLAEIFSIRDFRLLWFGAFFSFTGSWVQIVAQGSLIYQLTGSESKLGYVSAVNSLPVFVFGLAAGSIVDTRDRRRLLITALICFALASLYMSAATHFRFVTYEQVLLVSFLLGFVACIEMPARQSIVSRVVPPELLSAAIPIQAMTFNSARIVGPAIGGLLLARLGVSIGYVVNAATFLILIYSVAAIRGDLSAAILDRPPIRELIQEGTRYVWGEPRLRVLLIMESITAVFGIFYIPLMPAYVDQVLNMSAQTAAGKVALGNMYTAIGIGALITLIALTQTSASRYRALFIVAAMVTMSIGLILLSLGPSYPIAMILMTIIGGCTILQFNTTNALFQTIAPEALRGRSLSVHIWALNGFSPFGVAILSTVARETRLASLPLGITGGIPLAMKIGAIILAIGAVFGWTRRVTLLDVN